MGQRLPRPCPRFGKLRHEEGGKGSRHEEENEHRHTHSCRTPYRSIDKAASIPLRLRPKGISRFSAVFKGSGSGTHRAWQRDVRHRTEDAPAFPPRLLFRASWIL